MNYIISKILRNINGCAVKNSNIHKTARLDHSSVALNSSLGKYSYIGEHTSLICTKVGSFTSISNFCAIGGGMHPTEWVSTSPVFNSARSILHYNMSQNKYEPFVETTIGNDVWIGANCLIRGGVTIGDGAVVGMGSVVTKDIGPYEIWAGNPAKLIRKRFTDEKIDALLQSEWWNWDEETLKSKADMFNDVDAFVECLKTQNNNVEG